MKEWIGRLTSERGRRGIDKLLDLLRQKHLGFYFLDLLSNTPKNTNHHGSLDARNVCGSLRDCEYETV